MSWAAEESLKFAALSLRPSLLHASKALQACASPAQRVPRMEGARHERLQRLDCAVTALWAFLDYAAETGVWGAGGMYQCVQQRLSRNVYDRGRTGTR